MKTKTTTNWNELINNDTKGFIKLFAENKLSARNLTSMFKNTEYAGPFRSLIRGNGGVAKARELTKKALKRRNIV